MVKFPGEGIGPGATGPPKSVPKLYVLYTVHAYVCTLVVLIAKAREFGSLFGT